MRLVEDDSGAMTLKIEIPMEQEPGEVSKSEKSEVIVTTGMRPVGFNNRLVSVLMIEPYKTR
jgi:hypothetical protein